MKPIIWSKIDYSFLLADCKKTGKTGSREICDPPVSNTDDDIVLLVDDIQSFSKKAIEAGFEIGGSAPDSDLIERQVAEQRFASLTCQDVNLIVVDNDEFFEKFMLATRVAKKLNLTQKGDRISLFQAVLYGNG